MSIQAMKQALEALEEFGEHYDWCHQFPTYAFPENYPPCNCGYDEAITSLRQAIAEAEKQEPVAWLGFNERGECREVFTRNMKKTLPNYPTEGMTPVYTSPSHRQPLTDEELQQVMDAEEVNGNIAVAFARAIEAAHGIGEKNG